MKKSSINYLKWIKLSLGVPAAMLMASVFSLDYVSSAGIIVLLTIQDTTRETLSISLKRMIAFILMTILSFVVFESIGYHVLSYGAFLCLFMIICFRLKLDAAVTMNAVLATHYLSNKSMTPGAIWNEMALFLIGMGVGVVANLFMPENIQKIRMEQGRIDEAMKEILKQMSIYLCKEDKRGYTDEYFAQVDRLLLSMEKEANFRIQNTLTKADTYFLSYMQMRMKQCEVMKGMYVSIKALSDVPIQATAISNFLMEVGESFHEKNNVRKLEEHLSTMRSTYKLSELPRSREEFESRAVLMQVMRDLGHFLDIKRKFVEGMTEEDQAKYWR